MLNGDPTNEDRTNRVTDTLGFYKHTALGESGPITEDEVTDILTDLRHYCQRESIDFEEAITMSAIHFEAEILEGGEDHDTINQG